MAQVEIEDVGGISFNLQISDGNTVPSIDISGNETYLDIGSGTVLRLVWGYNPTYIEDFIDSYSVRIAYKLTPEEAPITQTTFDVGKINEFFVTSEILSKISSSDDYYLDISVASEERAETSSYSGAFIENVHICKASGMYIKVEEGYPQPILKRAIAFAKIPEQDTRIKKEILLDENGVALVDENGEYLYTEITDLEPVISNWKLMQDFYMKSPEGEWQKSDIRYEVLTDGLGEIITDITGEPIYTL